MTGRPQDPAVASVKQFLTASVAVQVEAPNNYCGTSEESTLTLLKGRKGRTRCPECRRRHARKDCLSLREKRISETQVTVLSRHPNMPAASEMTGQINDRTGSPKDLSKQQKESESGSLSPKTPVDEEIHTSADIWEQDFEYEGDISFFISNREVILRISNNLCI